MDKVQSLLFGRFPRRVGTPSQHWVFNEGQFNVFTESIQGRRNAYTTVSKLPLDGTEVSDKVFFDLDSPKKDEYFADKNDAEAVELMRRDESVAEDILGQVCEDARALARASRDDGIPVVGVFSGFGLHIHQLYQSTNEPEVAMATCVAKYVEELNIETNDWGVVGQVDRLCRVPNMQRCTDPGPREVVKDGVPTGVFQIPLSRSELCEVTPGWLLNRSHSARIPDDYGPSERPQMPVWEDYREETNAGNVDTPQRPVDSRTTPIDDDWIEPMLRDLLQMPCMVERIMSPNPDHKVRINCAVLLFNTGLTPQHVENLFSRLGWVDFDRETTRYFLDRLWENRYSDMSCSTLRSKGLCVVENPKECRTYGWSGGEDEWQ